MAKLENKGEIQTVPSLKGAYALLILLSKPLYRNIGALGFVSLVPGLYLSAGNAYGNGGFRARILRHLRPKKSLHWHVDALTEYGNIIKILSVPFGQECNLV